MQERVFVIEGTPLKYGPGASAETGWELARRGATRVFLVTDPGIEEAGLVDPVARSVRDAGIDVTVFSDVRVEPTLASMQRAADAATDGGFDGFVGVGGGSAMDTAKVAALAASHPAPLLEYVNAPLGGARPVPGPLRPLVMVPTSAGTGSEATSVAVLDVPEERVKTGISHRYLRPHQAVVDPDLVRSLPAPVMSACGLDVVCHAAESFLARPFDERPAPAEPGSRPPYQGANPVAELWSAHALELGGRHLRAAVAGDPEARGHLMLAATLAGIGFGSAGVHVPHACAYPIAARVRDFAPEGWPGDHPLVPHGWSVTVSAPAAFRWTYDAAPERHRRAAELLAGERLPDADADTLPALLTALMEDVGAPTRLGRLGFGEADVDGLAAGALAQQRLLAVAPRDVTQDDLAAILRASL